MTSDDARDIVLDVLDERLDERALAQVRTYTATQRKAGRDAMAQFLTEKGIDFGKLAASDLSADEIRAGVRRLISKGLS
jgi:hypothetical protein